MNPQMKNFKTFAKQTGVTLIEILVTVVIIAVGLLGLAVMQNISVKAAYDSYLRTQASFIAYDLIDRIRANPGNPTATPYSLASGVDATDTQCFDGDNCSINDIRNFDLFHAQENARELLPDSDLVVTFNNTTNIYTVTISWNDRTGDPADSTDPGDGEFSYHFQLDNG